MGWLRRLTDWLGEQITRVWRAVVEFVGDTIITVIEAALDLFAQLIEALPVPEFLTQYTLGSLLGGVGSDLLWILGAFRLDECFAIVGAGYLARLIRKLLTVGQW